MPNTGTVAVAAVVVVVRQAEARVQQAAVHPAVEAQASGLLLAQLIATVFTRLQIATVASDLL